MATKRLVLSAGPREVIGRKVKKLRLEGKIPANIFGKKIPSRSLILTKVEFEKAYRQAGSTTLIDLQIAGETKPRPVLVSNIQLHPVSDKILHVDLHEVDLTQKVTAAIPVRIVGESPAVKDKGAVLVTALTEIHVEALPADLPDHFEVNTDKLVEFGDSVLVKDLKVDPAVKILAKEDETVVTVQEPKKEEEAPTPTPAAAAEGESTAAGATQAAIDDKKPIVATESTKTGQPASKKPEEKKS